MSPYRCSRDEQGAVLLCGGAGAAVALCRAEEQGPPLRCVVRRSRGHRGAIRVLGGRGHRGARGPRSGRHAAIRQGTLWLVWRIPAGMPEPALGRPQHMLTRSPAYAHSLTCPRSHAHLRTPTFSHAYCTSGRVC